MNSKIAGYSKTEHFMLRQWQRNVSDDILFKALNNLDANKGDFLMVVSRDFAKRKSKQKTQELFVLIKNKTLITCFYGELKNLLTNKKKLNYKIIQQNQYEKFKK